MTRIHHCLAALALVTGLICTAPAASAAPLEAKQREAEALEAKIRQQGERLSVAGEDFNEARVDRQRLQTQAASARTLVVEAEGRWSKLRGQLSKRARLLYMHPAAALNAFFAARSLGDVARARVYGSEVMLTDSELVHAAERARHEVMERAQGLDDLRAQAQRKEDELEARRSQVQRELGAQRALLRDVKGDIAQIIAAERARQAAAAAAAVQNPSASPKSLPPREVVEPTGPPPPVRGSAGKAVATARAQLGKPYEWGASGPDSFDCSGLTMYAWNAAGVSLDHSSRAQFASLPHVARSQIQPGDLLFYGSPIHHVGIYEGGGVMINAPETGENVRRDSINRSDYAGAARP
ncbi:MAG TPA: NlpC/P60 family protein [Actinomycetota bacterium]|jgi:cell wall-associated NlpC family hydrolase|nr:NlpC/P60 family protein [Actinomycetota bacterium]